MLCKTEWSWKFRTWSYKMKSLDTLSTSPHYFCTNWIGATNENSNFYLRVQRVKRCLRLHLVRVCFGILWNCFKVHHGNWIVTTCCLLDSLRWKKKCNCINIIIFIRRCAVPYLCAQPHQSASCFDQPVSCAVVFMHLAIISTAYGTWSWRSHGHFDAVLFVFLRNLYRLS